MTTDELGRRVWLLLGVFASSASLWPVPADGQILNTGFEDEGTGPWLESHVDAPPECKPAAHHTPGGNPGSYAYFGEFQGDDGCFASTVLQDFTPVGNAVHRCCVSFDSRFEDNAEGTEMAFVDLDTSAGTVSADFPVVNGWTRYTICAPPGTCEGTARISFTLIVDLGPPFPGPTTILGIDNVVDSCSSDDATSPTLTVELLGSGGCGGGRRKGQECSPPGPLGSVLDVPAMSQWGLIVMTLFVMTAGTLVYARRRAIQA